MMRLNRAMLGLAALLSAGVNGASAAPVSRYNIDIAFTATVASVSGSGVIAGDNGFERDFSADELPFLSVNVGDQIHFRWRVLPSADAISCGDEGSPSDDRISLGGASEPSHPAAAECLGPTAVTAELRFADGRVSQLFEFEQDGAAFGYGPLLSRATGAVVSLEYAALDVLAGAGVGSCAYAYDAAGDTIVHSDASECLPTGKRNMGLGGFHVDETGGAATSQFEALDPNGYRLGGFLDYGFDIEWQVRHADRVPAPAAVGLFGIALLGLGLGRSRRRAIAALRQA